MNTTAQILLGIVTVATLTFLLMLFRMPLSDADFWLKVMSGVLAAFTFLSGAAALITGHVSGNRQAETILELEKGVAEARTKQAEAEKALLTMRERLFEPRTIPNWQEAKAILEGSKGKAALMYIPDNREAMTFAMQLFMLLVSSGWEVNPPVPGRWRFPTQGVTIIVHKDSVEEPQLAPHVVAFKKALWPTLEEFEGGAIETQVDESVPEDGLIIIVGPKN